MISASAAGKSFRPTCVASERSSLSARCVRSEIFRDGGVIIRQVAADQLGDDLGLGRRKEFSAHLRRQREVFLERAMRQIGNFPRWWGHNTAGRGGSARR